MRAAIIEDSEIDRLNLKTLLEDHSDVEIAGEAATVEDAVKLIDREQPDAVFLDIHLGRQKGFKALEKAAHKPLVVITTSHPHYAFQGFAIDAADFLLKPVEADTLARAVGRLRAQLAPAAAPGTNRLGLGDMQMFKTSEGMHLVPVGEIQAIVGDRIYTRVLVHDGREFLHNRPLREWRRILPESFHALDRSTIVNLREIEVVRDTGECPGQEIAFRGSAHKLCLGETALKALREAIEG